MITLFGTVESQVYFADQMHLILLPNIYYEVLIETSEGRTTSEFFASSNILQSREQSISRFLQLTSDELMCDEIFVTLYGRYHPTGERITMIDTVSAEHPGETLDALAQELEWYQYENLAVNLAVYDPAKPSIIKIIWPQHRYSALREGSHVALFLSCQYWAFVGYKKEILRYGNVF